MNKRLKKAVKSRESKWEGFVLFSLAIIACVVVFIIGAPDKWLTAIYCTIPTFSGTIAYFKNRWSSPTFWTTISVCFALHLVLTWFIFAILLRQRDDVGFLVCLPFIFLEGFVIYHLVRQVGEQRLLRTDERK
jgi:ABC-type Na+ efflux pump permease subunit